jgi:hypothetical protein
MSHNEINGALPANAWLDKEQLMIRLREEEIVEIDDFFTNVATKEAMEKVDQLKDYHMENREGSHDEGHDKEEIPLQQPPLLSFGTEKKNAIEPPKEQESNLPETLDMNGKMKRKRIEEMSKDELVAYLKKMPTLMPSPVCDFIVEDGKRLRGTVEKVKGEYVYIKVAFGKKWIKYTLRQIKDIKIVRF